MRLNERWIEGSSGRRRGGERMWNKFKAFVLQGNVVDMAVGVIVGTAELNP